MQQCGDVRALLRWHNFEAWPSDGLQQRSVSHASINMRAVGDARCGNREAPKPRVPSRDCSISFRTKRHASVQTSANHGQAQYMAIRDQSCAVMFSCDARQQTAPAEVVPCEAPAPRPAIVLFSEHILWPNLLPKCAHLLILFTPCHYVSQPCFWPHLLLLLFNKGSPNHTARSCYVPVLNCSYTPDACDIPVVHDQQKSSHAHPKCHSVGLPHCTRQNRACGPIVFASCAFFKSEDARWNISASREHQREPRKKIFKL